MISCAPVSYDFVPRPCCSRDFCLTGLSHGSQTSLFLPFPFHVACVNEPSPQLLWHDLVIYPLDPMTEGLTCSVNCVSDTTSQVFHRDSLSTERLSLCLVHCLVTCALWETIAFVAPNNRDFRKGIHVSVVIRWF